MSELTVLFLMNFLLKILIKVKNLTIRLYNNEYNNNFSRISFYLFRKLMWKCNGVIFLVYFQSNNKNKKIIQDQIIFSFFLLFFLIIRTLLKPSVQEVFEKFKYFLYFLPTISQVTFGSTMKIENWRRIYLWQACMNYLTEIRIKKMQQKVSKYYYYFRFQTSTKCWISTREKCKKNRTTVEIEMVQNDYWDGKKM